MSNSAVVKPANSNIGVYLHWNGGPVSVSAFLEYCKLKNYRPLSDGYGIARFTQVVANFFGGNCSIGIEANVYEDEKCASGLDNGIYVVDGWNIVNRVGRVSSRENYDLNEMLKEIDKKQPQEEQLGDFLDAKKVKREDVKVGDMVFMQELNGTYKKYEVVGFGEDRYCNGTCIKGLPCVAKYGKVGSSPIVDYSGNINNYVRDEEVRVAADK